ncbi:MAG: type II toxin-antitoxin system VapC family toxin [Caulobacteraceae bacterium]
MILLDTHVLIWTMEEDHRLGRKARSTIDDETGASGILVSAITPWEVALLVAKGRLTLGREVGEWIKRALSAGVRLAALEPEIAIEAVKLPGGLHRDPADRFIVATARHRGCLLLTADRAILAYAEQGHVSVLDAAL